MDKLLSKAITATRKYCNKSPTGELDTFYSLSDDSKEAIVVIKYMQIEKHGHGKIKHENYYVNRTLAIKAVVAMMDVLNSHGVECEVKEFQEFSFGFEVSIDHEKIKKTVIHTMKD